MMGPNMATMLALIMTDAALDPAAAQAALARGHQRELQLHERRRPHEHQRHGAAVGQRRGGRRSRWPATTWPQFQPALDEVCVDLAKAIAGDGEGATHLVTIEVSGCADRRLRLDHRQDRGQQPPGEDGHPRGRSELGAHRLRGRLRRRAVRSRAASRCGSTASCSIATASPSAFDGKAVSDSIRDHRDTLVELTFREGAAAVRFWTTDLTAEYVRLNADYHT